jgi:hypothetical protein
MAGPEEKFEGRMHGPQEVPEGRDGLWLRLLYMILIWLMIQVAYTVLGVAVLVQFVIMLVSQGKPNPRLAEFGTGMGIWIAKSARYLTADSEVKPWPWTELD